jgi:pyrimidine operon attenuation protein/uracil phosphoribosyltransferase
LAVFCLLTTWYDTTKPVSFQAFSPANSRGISPAHPQKLGGQSLLNWQQVGILGAEMRPDRPKGLLKMKVILNSQQIDQILDDLAARIVAETPHELDVVAIGIRSRGEVLAQRLSARLSRKLGKDVPYGTLDITLYRDDLNSPQSTSQPQVRTTEIGFNIDDKIIILVDDVLYTGRSTRAAMDALIDLGRPKAIKLAVLVDRAGRELPIQADYAGYKTDVEPGKVVQVTLVESDGKDEVVVE